MTKASKMTSVTGRALLLLVALFLVTGCDTGVRYMGPTEHGIRFRSYLPPALGGGVSSKVVGPGEMVIIWPWDKLYRFDTSVRDIAFGAEHEDTTAAPGLVYTRARDGNEVALGVTVSYGIDPAPAKIQKLLQEVGPSEARIRELVVNIGRADIRTYMNTLSTEEFALEKKRNEAVESVKTHMAERLEKYGIEIYLVKLDRFQFERLLKNGDTDPAYQQRLSAIQALFQRTERERLAQDTIKAQMDQKLKEAQVASTGAIEQARGYMKAAEVRGKGYLDRKKNEAEGILATGRADVKGLVEQINALSGPGGQAILRLEIARQLVKNNPQFVVVGEGGRESMGVNRVDTNDLIRHLGILETAPKQPVEKSKEPVTHAPSGPSTPTSTENKTGEKQ